MSLRFFLNQPGTIVHPAQLSTGYDYGGAATRVAAVGNLQQARTSTETTGFPKSAPSATVSEWTLVLGPSEVIGPPDRWEQDGRVFEVVGEPNVLRRRRRGTHHLEVQLRSVG